MRVLLILVLCCLSLTARSESPPLTKFLALGTASESGVFHPVGNALCDTINLDRIAELVRCLPYTSGGSVYNIHAILSGELDLGITRSDLAFQAFHGKGEFTAPASSLRIVASLYGMPVTVIARRDAGIRSIEDIAGKRINLGNRGSGQRNIVELLLRTLGLQASDFAATTELPTSAMGKAFCNGQIDVMVEALGNPASFYKHAIEECNGIIVPLTATVLERIVHDNPHLGRLTIPGGLYRGHDQPLPSFGFKAVLVTSAATDSEAIFRVSRSLFTHFEQLKTFHPVLQTLEADHMLREGITIPLHEGARKYLATRGLP